MVFETFLRTYREHPVRHGQGEMWVDDRLLGVRGYRELLGEHAGATFENGLYRLHSASTAQLASELIADAFPDIAAHVRPFGYDWLGRQFVVDFGSVDRSGAPIVTMLAVGEGATFDMQADLVRFHDVELLEHPAEALALPLFEEWADQHQDALPLPHQDCVGYRLPLFVGGREELANLELSDLDVYWTLCGQLLQQVQHLPEGTPIRGFTITDPE